MLLNKLRNEKLICFPCLQYIEELEYMYWHVYVVFLPTHTYMCALKRELKYCVIDISFKIRPKLFLKTFAVHSI